MPGARRARPPTAATTLATTRPATISARAKRPGTVTGLLPERSDRTKATAPGLPARRAACTRCAHRSPTGSALPSRDDGEEARTRPDRTTLTEVSLCRHRPRSPHWTARTATPSGPTPRRRAPPSRRTPAPATSSSVSTAASPRSAPSAGPPTRPPAAARPCGSCTPPPISGDISPRGRRPRRCPARGRSPARRSRSPGTPSTTWPPRPRSSPASRSRRSCAPGQRAS